MLAESRQFVIGHGATSCKIQRAQISKARTPPMTLSKDHFVSAVAEANGYPRNRSVELIDTLLEIIKSNLVSKEDVLISGFGKFCVKAKCQRRGRNPATGEAMMLDALRVVTFKCSGQLRDKINNSQ
jgi:integration host factor subunit alpha